MSDSRHVVTSTASLSGLVDALDAVIGEGAVVAGDIVITLGDIDLIRLDLRLLLAGIQGEPTAARGAA
jgi:Gas vesicle protein